MANYITAAQVRLYTGLSETDASDADLAEFLSPATKAVIEQITAQKEWEIMSGDLSSTIFYTSKYPIADITGTKTVTTDEVEVYTWTDRGDASTRTEVTVSAVDASQGQVTLATAPGSTTDIVTCTYRFYQNPVDYELVTLATAFYCGYLYALTKWIWIPSTYRMGPIYLRNQVPIWERLHKEYVRTLNGIQKRNYSLSKPWVSKSLQDMDKEWLSGSSSSDSDPR